MLVLLTICSIWLILILLLYRWKKELLQATWQEPYFKDSPILIESDDWGLGGSFHAKRLETLLDHLKQHKDSTGRTAILTADTVLGAKNSCVNSTEKATETPKRSTRNSEK
ncbi:MAG: hypothetical protein DRR42_26535 [Gammaproteobacteria bacterium]|nr:MAG: hypothetical protein DRR42_26535 [Gammaproteobacteria bacterium]